MNVDVGKYFLQFMLRNSYVSLNDALRFCALHTDELDTTAAFKTLISDINRNIVKQELKITILKCEVTGEMKLALINIANDDISKLQTAFSPIEVQYFQAILKELLTADDHRLPIMHCLNVSNNLTSTMRKDNAEAVLDKWTNSGYLVDKDSYIYLGPRCIAEFAPYFHTHCQEFYSSCNLCSEPAFTGEVCKSCDKIMHKHCLQKYLQKHNNCPSCKIAWNSHTSESQKSPDSSDSDEEMASPPIAKRRRT